VRRHIAVFSAVALAIAAAALSAQEPAGVARLKWMTGCWELRSGTRLIEERWTSPRGGLLLGTSRTSRSDSIVEFEQIRIETRSDGIFYVASPSRQATAEFKASSVLDSAVVFENPAHDFPKKISYRKAGADSIIASIEGPRGGQTRTIAYPYRRVSCDAT
jgi:hypothetical protein